MDLLDFHLLCEMNNEAVCKLRWDGRTVGWMDESSGETANLCGLCRKLHVCITLYCITELHNIFLYL